MPKPRGQYKSWEARITPSEELTEERVEQFRQGLDDSAVKYIIAREGGDGTEKQLHYHLYIETNASESFLRKQFVILSGGTGNKYYSIKQAHQGTIGYVVKEGNVQYRHNYTQTHIEEYIRDSEQYRKEKEAQRKRQQRIKMSEVQQARIYVEQAIPEGQRTISNVYDEIENYYNEIKKSMPSRIIMEHTIVNLVGGYTRKNYYLNNLQRI